MAAKKGFESIDEYILSAPAEVQNILQEIRETIQAAAPDATEAIAYQMPAFKLKGTLVYFSAWKKHIGFYPASGLVFDAFSDQIANFEGTSGSIHFPLNKPMPLQLIRDIVEFRVIEDLKHHEDKAKAKAAAKKSKKKDDKA